MLDQYIYIFLAILGLGFLIFIHELGHYYMAKYVGMKVEAFGIGFGRPIYKWTQGGVEWRLNWLPFGGYVKIAGMEMVKGTDPYSIPGGFFTKPPLDRIKVALAGPVVNLLFAFLMFSMIWLVGGREKNFSEYTRKIGWIDPKSTLYAQGVRPGDEIVSYDGIEYTSNRDHLLAAMTSGGKLDVKGLFVDYKSGEKKEFNFAIKPYPHPDSINDEILTTGVTMPAGQVIYRPSKLSDEHKEMAKAIGENIGGIEEGDRIVWADGERIFSHQQLREILNSGKALLTIKRGDDTFLRRVPRVPIYELRLNQEVKNEFADYQYESGLTDQKLSDLDVIPYDLTPNGVVQKRLAFVDQEIADDSFPELPFSEREEPLQEGDQIIAVDGMPVKYSYQVFYQLQQNKVNVIVLRDPSLTDPIPSEKADEQFDALVDMERLGRIASSIGTPNETKQSGSYVLLEPIIPQKRIDLMKGTKELDDYQARLAKREEQIEQMDSVELREKNRQLLKEEKEELILGLIGIQDQAVIYRPNPLTMFADVTAEMWNTMSALFTGSLSPKWLSGPVGIVQAVQKSWQVSVMEVVFWMGLISLNLGYLNLLPIPVLDGGYIVLFLFEMVTGKKVKPESLEKVILPFFLLLVALILFITVHDISRIFGLFR